MLRDISFVIVTAIMGGISGLAIILLLKLIRLQRQEIQTLTEKALSLASAKDFQTFAAMETMNLPSPESVEQAPLDDVSIAKYLSQRYADQGLDPNLAYAKEDDPINDFGGPQAFLG